MSLPTAASTENQHGEPAHPEEIAQSEIDQTVKSVNPYNGFEKDAGGEQGVEGRQPGHDEPTLHEESRDTIDSDEEENKGGYKSKKVPTAAPKSLKDSKASVEDKPPLAIIHPGAARGTQDTRDLTAMSEVEGLTKPPPLPPKDNVYLDPTPKTPIASTVPSRSHSSAGSNNEEKDAFEDPATFPPSSRSMSVATFDEKQGLGDNQTQDDDSRSEIQSIMDQFDEDKGPSGEAEIMSPRLEVANPYMGSMIQHPPRISSLEPLHPRDGSGDGSQKLTPDRTIQSSTADGQDSEKSPPVPPKPYLVANQGSSGPYRSGNVSAEELSSSQTLSPLHNPPPPEPEPDLPFDFHRFLEQLRHRSADPVAGFLRSFLSEFGRKQWMVHEQVKIVSDFLTFITNKMEHCEVWRGVSDAEFDNAREGMEKLVMNRLYAQTFSPAIPSPQPMPSIKGKKRQSERSTSGRRGQHQEDVERDDVLAQKVQIYGWVQEVHLDIPPVGNEGRRFLRLAQQGI